MATDSEAGYVTPLVRKLAAEHGVDLGSHRHRRRRPDPQAGRARRRRGSQGGRRGSQGRPQPAAGSPGAGSRRRAAAAAPPVEASSLRGTTEKMSRLRKTIAKRMVESLQVSAQLTATVEVDLTAISRIRPAPRTTSRRARARACPTCPSSPRQRSRRSRSTRRSTPPSTPRRATITYPSAEHVGIAVDTEKGLLVPVIKDAGDLNIAGLAKKIADLAARTRHNKVTPGRAQRRHVHDHQLRLRRAP